MNWSWKNWFLLFLLWLPASGAARADVVFVFGGDTPLAAVYDAATLRPLAVPSVGMGARQAFGIPDPDAPYGFAKFFVTGRDAVVVLDSGFQVRRTIALSAPAAGTHSATLAANGSRLVVAAGRQILTIDTASERLLNSIAVDFTAIAVISTPAPNKVLVLADRSVLLRELDLDSLQLADSAAAMPRAISSLAAAPNRSWIYGIGGGSLYDLLLPSASPLLRVSTPGGSAKTASGAPLRPAQRFLDDSLIQKIVLADNGRYAMLSSGRVSQGWVVGSPDSADVSDPSVGTQTPLEANDIALSSQGSTLYAVSPRERTLLKVNLDDTSQSQVAALSLEPSSVALVSPQPSQTSGKLEQSSAPAQQVAGNKSFSVSVKASTAAGAPQSGLVVFASSVSPATAPVQCFSNLTGADGIGTLFCTVGAVAQAAVARVTVSDNMGRTAPTFEIALRVPAATEGLVKTDGDFASVPENANFALVVTATKDRLPQAGLSLTVSANLAPPKLVCPPRVTVDANGKATINCRSGVVSTEVSSAKVNTEITVSDGERTVVFSVTIDPLKTLQEGLAKVSGDGQRVAQGLDVPLPLVVRSVVNGEPRVNEQLVISVNTPMALTCPVWVFTDEQGFGFIRCRGGTVFGESLVLVTVGGPNGSQVQFTVTVRASSVGLATNLEIATDGPILGVVGERRTNGVRVIALDTGGQRVAAKTVFFTSEDGVTFDPPMAITDGLGEATTTVIFGCAQNNRGSIEVGFTEDDFDDSIDFRLTPGPFAQIVKEQGDNQSGSPGQTLSSAALRIRASDMCGNPIPDQRIIWRPNPVPRATFRNVVDITNRTGQSSVLVELGNYGGPFTVTAQAGEVTATFNLNVNLQPSQLRRISGNNQSAAPGTIAQQPLVVEVAGTNGFGVSNVDVTFAVTQGSATLTRTATKTDGLGVAFTAVQVGASGGPVTVTASAIGQSVTFTIQSGAGGGPNAPLQGFVNGASFEAGWVSGSLGTIFGTGITGISGIVAASQAPFPTNLEGVRVTVNGVPAPIISLVNVAGQEQINLQVPFGISVGAATVVIDNNGSTVTIEGVPIRRAQPGIFEYTLGDVRLAAALHADFTVVTPDNPAVPGEIIQLYLTGLGALNPQVQTNTPGPIPAAVTTLDPLVEIEGVAVEDFGGFYAPTLITAYQVNFRVSANAQTGNLRLKVTIDGVSSQESRLPVRRP